jgi:hypothetical protein
MKNFYGITRKSAIFCSALALMASAQPLSANSALAQTEARAPGLIITHAPLPESLREKIYGAPRKPREITPQQISGDTYRSVASSTIGREISTLEWDLSTLHSNIGSLTSTIETLQRDSEQYSAQYYANVGTINTQLQSGTTPGNPRLVAKLADAQNNLEALNSNISQMNDQAVRAAEVASQASFILNNVRAAYRLSGAVEEDHVRLAELEDSVNSTVVVIERILNNVSDSIARSTAYLSTERNNIRTLALAVENGDLYGRSLSNRPFSMATPYSGNVDGGYVQPASAPAAAMDQAYYNDNTQMQAQPAALPAGGRPLAKIKFDRNDVDYEQAVYVAVNEAMTRYPNARFDLVAVHPTQGNAAEVAIESTRARRNAERVLRTLTQMGVPSENIDLSYDQSDAAQTNEVHIFIK